MSFINYAGGRVLDGMQQQLKEVKNTISLLVNKNLANDMVAKIIDQVSSNQNEGRRLLITKIENQTLELNQVISADNTLQTNYIPCLEQRGQKPYPDQRHIPV